MLRGGLVACLPRVAIRLKNHFSAVLVLASVSDDCNMGIASWCGIQRLSLLGQLCTYVFGTPYITWRSTLCKTVECLFTNIVININLKLMLVGLKIKQSL